MKDGIGGSYFPGESVFTGRFITFVRAAGCRRDGGGCSRVSQRSLKRNLKGAIVRRCVTHRSVPVDRVVGGGARQIEVSGNFVPGIFVER